MGTSAAAAGAADGALLGPASPELEPASPERLRLWGAAAGAALEAAGALAIAAARSTCAAGAGTAGLGAAAGAATCLPRLLGAMERPLEAVG